MERTLFCLHHKDQIKFMKEVVVAGICYNLNEEDKTASILQKEDDNVSEVIIPSFINDNGNTYVVTNIGHHAFAYSYCFSSVTSISIPDSVTDIGEGAFSCQRSLRSITFPNSVKNIGRAAFEGCSSIHSIRIPSSVISIGEQAFSFCDSLLSIVVDIKNQQYDSREECNAIVETKTNILITGCCKSIIPNGVIGIGNYAFCGFESLISITIPNSVTSIGHYAFCRCENITDIKLPNSIISIGHNAFGCCYSLTDIVLPCNITSIEQKTFQYCSSLVSINLPNGVKTIGERAFDGCSSLKYIELPQSLLSIEMEAFGGCTSLSYIVIPNNVNNIAWWAFSGCSSLTRINIPTSLNGIESNVFYNCSSLRSLNLNNITYIKHGAFHNTAIYNDESNWDNGALYIDNCLIEVKLDAIKERFVIKEDTRLIASAAFPINSMLKFLTIPNSVTSIGDWAFSSCLSLTSIIMPDNIQRLGINIFDSCQSLQIICVPQEKKGAYCRMGLEKYCDFILEGEYIEQEIDDINYRLNNYTLTAEVIQRAEGYIGSIIIPSSVVYQKATYVVTKIEGILIEEDYSHIIGPFVNCQELTSIFIPDTVTYIGEAIFDNCISLSSIEVAPDNHKYDSRSNCNAIIETSTDTLIAGCKNTIIPNNIKTIASSAFSASTPTTIIFPKTLHKICHGAFCECAQLNTINIPNSLQIIDDMVFSCCENLSAIEFENGLQYIGNGAFEGIAVTSLILPNSVTFLGAFAFAGCTLLTSITLSKNLTNIGEKVFDSCESLQIIRVPKGKKEEYCKLGLEPYRDLIQEPQEEEYTILLNIAKGYELGIGITKNLAQAVIIYAQAAEKGCAEAAYHLGELYETGKGLPLDYQQAIVWYTKAVALYHPSAGQRKKHCEKILHEEEQRLFEQHKPPKYHQNQLQSSIQTAKYLFFDTETTGLPPRDLEDSSYDQIDVWPRFVQIGWIVTDANGNTIKRRSEIIRPEGFIIPKDASDVHGITTEKAMQTGVPIGKVLREIYDDMLHVKLLVAHNFGFDHKILGAEFYRKNIDTNIIDDKEHICTMLSTTNYCELLPIRFGEYKWPKLEELHHKLFGCTFSDAHDALADVEATKKCFFELKKKGIL